MSYLEDLFLSHIQEHPLPAPHEQYHFAAKEVGDGKGVRARLKKAGLQDWRFDFAWPDLLLAVEVEGGTWMRGRHSRGSGFESDCRKYNTALLLGWRVLRYTGSMIKSKEAIKQVARILEQK